MKVHDKYLGAIIGGKMTKINEKLYDLYLTHKHLI